MLLRVVLAVLAGLAAAAAFEPFHLSLLLPLSVAGYVLAVRGTTAWASLVPGAAYGVSFFFALQIWMRAVGTDAWIGLSALEAAFLALLAPVVSHLVRRTQWWPLWVAAAWVSVEQLRSGWPFSGMPWGRLSYASADTWWAQGLPWFGFTGVSLLIALTGTTLAWWLLRWRAAQPRPQRRVGVSLAALVALGTVGPVLLPWYDDALATGTVTVAAVQGDVPGSGDDLIAVHREVTQLQTDATVALGQEVAAGERAEPHFVLWPENSTAVDPFADSIARRSIEEAVDAVQVPVLVGAMVSDVRGDRVLNQGIVWDPLTGPGDRYTKWHPVPFGEYVPWRDLFFKENVGRLRQIGRDMMAGTRTQPLDVNGLPVADAICFDVAYDDTLHAQVREGAQLVTIQTSNAMFIHTHQIDQQFEITRLRALETGRSVAVAAVNGRTAVIGPDGAILHQVDPRTTAVAQAEAPLVEKTTPAVHLAAPLGWLLVLATVMSCLMPVTRSWRIGYVQRVRRQLPSDSGRF